MIMFCEFELLRSLTVWLICKQGSWVQTMHIIFYALRFLLQVGSIKIMFYLLTYLLF